MERAALEGLVAVAEANSGDPVDLQVRTGPGDALLRNLARHLEVQVRALAS